MRYADAYTKLIDTALISLESIETPDNVRPFVLQTAAQVRELSAKTPEFYVGEFFSRFKDEVVERCQAEAEACQQAVHDAHAEGATASAELQARFDAAHAAGDREAEHAVWRDREIGQAAVQAKVDAAGKRADVISLRLDACLELASTLGINLD